MAKKQVSGLCSITQEPEVQPQPPKVEAPQTKAFLLKQLNTLESDVSEARSKIDKLDEKISQLKGEKGMWEGTLREAEKKKSELLILYEEIGGKAWDVTGY